MATKLGQRKHDSSGGLALPGDSAPTESRREASEEQDALENRYG